MQPAPLSPSRQRADEASHLESLAQETDTSLNLVRAIYTEEIRTLEEQARVRTFVTVIAMRRTRLILQSLGAGKTVADMH